MKNKKGRPKGALGKNNTGRLTVRTTISLYPEEKALFIKLGGSSWVRGKLQEEKEKRDES